MRKIRTNLNRPSHLAWDWLGRNFYFFSDGYINTCNENGSWCFDLLPTGLSAINSLLVVPEEGYLFFSVWGAAMSSQTGFIERSDLDGLRHRRIISHDSRMQQPSSLTSDVVNKKIYWTDSHMASVGVSDYNGHQRKIILSYSLSMPFGLGMYEDYLYVSNIGTDTLTKVSKFDGRSRTIFHRGNVKSESIKIVHRIAQMIGEYHK